MSAIAFEGANHIIRRSIDREIGLLEMKKRLTDDEIKDFERRYGIDSTEFIKQFEQGSLGATQDRFEWLGLLKDDLVRG